MTLALHFNHNDTNNNAEFKHFPPNSLPHSARGQLLTNKTATKKGRHQQSTAQTNVEGNAFVGSAPCRHFVPLLAPLPTSFCNSSQNKRDSFFIRHHQSPSISKVRHYRKAIH
jgi:hypothetical protein